MEISEVTRRNILDGLLLERVAWCGQLDEIEFLNRLYKLSGLPSHDGRFAHAENDIWQHRVNNLDWEDDWIFNDSRFNLLRGPDQEFLRFLCEMLHPVVRPDSSQVQTLLSHFNEALNVDGWEIVATTRLAGRPIFSARPRSLRPDGGVTHVKKIAEVLDSSYITQQITRIEAAVHGDPELAIGQSKELVETVCKSILSNEGIEIPKNPELPQLVKLMLKHLQLLPENIPDEAKGAETIRRLLSNLASLSNSMAEIRNLYGTGHGKDGRANRVEPRHAKLAVGTAVVLVVFVFETYTERKKIANKI